MFDSQNLKAASATVMPAQSHFDLYTRCNAVITVWSRIVSGHTGYMLVNAPIAAFGGPTLILRYENRCRISCAPRTEKSRARQTGLRRICRRSYHIRRNLITQCDFAQVLTFHFGCCLQRAIAGRILVVVKRNEWGVMCNCAWQE